MISPADDILAETTSHINVPIDIHNKTSLANSINKHMTIFQLMVEGRLFQSEFPVSVT